MAIETCKIEIRNILNGDIINTYNNICIEEFKRKKLKKPISNVIIRDNRNDCFVLFTIIDTELIKEFNKNIYKIYGEIRSMLK